MISIVVLAFSGIALTVFSWEEALKPVHTLHTDMQENIDTSTGALQIFHIGGDTIDLDEIKVVLFANGNKYEFNGSDTCVTVLHPDGSVEPKYGIYTVGDCMEIDTTEKITLPSNSPIEIFVVHSPFQQVIQNTVIQKSSSELPYWITPEPYGSICDKSGNNNETFLPQELVGCIGDGLVTDCHMEKGFESYEIFNFGIEEYELNIKDPLTTVLLKVVYSSHDNSQKDMALEINVGGSDWIDVASIKGPKQTDPDTYDITSYVNTIAKLDNLTVRFSANGNAASHNKDVWFDFVGVHFESGSKEKNTPTVTWSNPADIVYETPLSSTQLSASASVPGTFTYTPASGTILNAGTQILHVYFTPTDTANYNTVSQDVTVNVNKANPIVTWSNPANISYGTALSSTQLNAVSSVPGTYIYNPLAGTILNVGTQALHVNFTPTDTANYTNATANVTINVSKATPTITWNNPANITYKTALNSTQLNAVANDPVIGNTVNGSFVYNQTAGTVLSVGTHTLHVYFTPTDTANYYTASKDVTVNVNKATPTITWSNPADIVYGTALSSTQLNAVSSIPGAFNYTPASGTKLNVGTQSLHVDFTPTDTANYYTASADVQINVIAAQVPIADFTATPTSGKHPLDVSFNDTSTGTPTSWEWKFGDGSISTDQKSTSHRYNQKGTYTVSLTVKNEFGTNTTIKTDYIKVTNDKN